MNAVLAMPRRLRPVLVRTTVASGVPTQPPMPPDDEPDEPAPIGEPPGPIPIPTQPESPPMQLAVSAFR